LPQLRDLQLERAGAGVELAGTEPKTPETSAESAADTGRSREPQIPTIPATKTTPRGDAYTVKSASRRSEG
jgi:hypothetical protein